MPKERFDFSQFEDKEEEEDPIESNADLSFLVDHRIDREIQRKKSNIDPFKEFGPDNTGVYATKITLNDAFDKIEAGGAGAIDDIIEDPKDIRSVLQHADVTGFRRALGIVGQKGVKFDKEWVAKQWVDYTGDLVHYALAAIFTSSKEDKAKFLKSLDPDINKIVTSRYDNVTRMQYKNGDVVTLDGTADTGTDFILNYVGLGKLMSWAGMIKKFPLITQAINKAKQLDRAGIRRAESFSKYITAPANFAKGRIADFSTGAVEGAIQDTVQYGVTGEGGENQTTQSGVGTMLFGPLFRKISRKVSGTDLKPSDDDIARRIGKEMDDNGLSKEIDDIRFNQLTPETQSKMLNLTTVLDKTGAFEGGITKSEIFDTVLDLNAKSTAFSKEYGG